MACGRSLAGKWLALASIGKDSGARKERLRATVVRQKSVVLCTRSMIFFLYIPKYLRIFAFLIIDVGGTCGVAVSWVYRSYQQLVKLE